MVKLLIANNAEVNAKLENSDMADGTTALFYAASSGKTDVAKLLIDNGADVNAKTVSGNTALMEALDRKQFGMIKLLIANGADVNLTTGTGTTALMKAVERGNFDQVVDLYLRDLGLELIDSQYSWNTVTPILLENDNIPIADDTSPPALAGLKNMLLLLNHGADVNIQDKNNRTALMTAAGIGSLEIVRLFLHHNANIELKDNDGMTALDIARKHNHDEIVQLLMKA